MKLCVIGSSSAGNSYLLEARGSRILLDCGISFSTIRKTAGFNLLGLNCLITHEHKDHCRAAQDLQRAAVNIYASRGTAEAIGISGHHRTFIVGLEQFAIGPFLIRSFPTVHDAQEPMGFLIYHKPTKEKLLFATDTSYIASRFQGVNYFMIECNYDPCTLEDNILAGTIDNIMRKKTRNHFSLPNVKEFLNVNVGFDARKIILLHLSGNNSDAARMKKEIEELVRVETIIAEPGIEIDL